MTDREILELCAKAMGKNAQWDCPERGMMVMSANGCDTDTWNPLTSADNYEEIEAYLGIDVVWSSDAVSAIYCNPSIDEYIEDMQLFSNHSGDKRAAKRKAGCTVVAEVALIMVKQ